MPSSAFDSAAAFLSNAPSSNSTSTATKLEIYGLYKYLTVAPSPNTSKPSIFDMTGRAKWDAWNRAGSFYFSNEDAEAKYLDIARGMGWTEDTVITKPEPEPADEDEDEDDIWDDDDEDSSHSNTSKRGGSSGGFGLAVSQVSQPEQEDDDGSVHYLAVSNKAARLQALLETQAEVIDTRDEYGYTPLQLAADRGNVDAVRVLLANGADRMLKDPDDLPASELAKIAGHNELARIIIAP